MPLSASITDEFCAAPQVKVREQMTDVFAHRDVFEPHLRRDGFGRKTACEPRERFVFPGREPEVRSVPRFAATVQLGFSWFACRCVGGADWGGPFDCARLSRLNS
jgi:hypothetical protein